MRRARSLAISMKNWLPTVMESRVWAATVSTASPRWFISRKYSRAVARVKASSSTALAPASCQGRLWMQMVWSWGALMAAHLVSAAISR